MSRLGAIPRPTSDEIDITDSNGSDQDIATNYRDDSGAHRWYITWWGRTYPGDIFPIDYPRGNPKPWRQSGDREGSDTSEEGSDDQVDDIEEQEAGKDGDDLDIGEGDWDGDDEEDREDEDEEDEDEEEADEEEEEDESDAVPHHLGEDTIALDPLSLPV